MAHVAVLTLVAAEDERTIVGHASTDAPLLAEIFEETHAFVLTRPAADAAGESGVGARLAALLDDLSADRVVLLGPEKGGALPERAAALAAWPGEEAVVVVSPASKESLCAIASRDEARAACLGRADDATWPSTASALFDSLSAERVDFDRLGLGSVEC